MQVSELGNNGHTWRRGGTVLVEKGKEKAQVSGGNKHGTHEEGLDIPLP